MPPIRPTSSLCKVRTAKRKKERRGERSSKSTDDLRSFRKSRGSLLKILCCSDCEWVTIQCTRNSRRKSERVYASRREQRELTRVSNRRSEHARVRAQSLSHALHLRYLCYSVFTYTRVNVCESRANLALHKQRCTCIYLHHTYGPSMVHSTQPREQLR